MRIHPARRNSALLTIATVSLTLLLSSCVSGQPIVETTESEVSTERPTACTPTNDGENLQTIVVGQSTGVVSEPYVEWGVRERCFEKYGLVVESVSGANQAARTAGLVGGSIDVVSNHIRSVIQSVGNSEFTPLFVSVHYGYSAKTLEAARASDGFDGELIVESALIARPGSDITGWSGLNGKRLGFVNTTSTPVKGLSELSRQGFLDFESIEILGLDNQEVLTSLLRGDLDAGGLAGALALEALSAGGTLIGYPSAFFDEPGASQIWVANGNASEEKRQLLVRFQQAMWEIYGLMENPLHEESVLDLMQEKYKIDDATRAATRVPEFLARQVKVEELEALVPKMILFGDIDEEIVFISSMFLGG